MCTALAPRWRLPEEASKQTSDQRSNLNLKAGSDDVLFCQHFPQMDGNATINRGALSLEFFTVIRYLATLMLSSAAVALSSAQLSATAQEALRSDAHHDLPYLMAAKSEHADADLNPKDVWDIFAIVSAALLPVALFYIGYIQKQRENDLAAIQSVSQFVDSVVDNPDQKRRITLVLMSKLLNDDLKRDIYPLVVEHDSDDSIRNTAYDSFVRILSDYQRNCLGNMYRDWEFLFQRHTPNASVHKVEIKNLFSAGLIERRPGPHGFRSLFNATTDQDIRDHFQLTEQGRQLAEQLNTL